MKRDSVHFQNPMESFNDQYTQRQYTQERGHSRMYHGYQSNKEPVYTMDVGHKHTEPDFRRTYYSTSAPFFSNSVQDARKHYVDSQCTRKMISGDTHNCFVPDPLCKSKTNECQREQSHNCPQSNPCQHNAVTRPDKLCPCNEPPPVQCDCNRKCQPTTNCPSFTTTHCPYRRVGGDEPDKTNQFDNYDLFHNLEVKSGEEDTPPKQPWHFDNPNPVKLDKNEYIGSKSDPQSQVKAKVGESKTRTLQDSYRSFDYSERKKRDLEDQTFKPFWQMDEYNQKRLPELKSIRYTTLANKRYKKTRKTAPTTRLQTSTETITIKPKDQSSVHYGHRGRVTEKYLSFDELMHLRKLSTPDSVDNDARRRADSFALREGNETTVDAKTTYTANTPFIRQKHCTRKLTCTWTAPMVALKRVSGEGGGGGGGGFDVGSRTPPGYVDGCTRTSTCTRDYMERNKMTVSSESPDGTTVADEDYCERRSLNIRRRNSNENDVNLFGIGYQDAHTKRPLLTSKNDEVVTSVENEDTEVGSQTDNFHCICYEDATRVKRGEIYSLDQLLINVGNGVKGDTKSNSLSSDDDYSRHKLLTSGSKNSIISYQCPCNGTKSLRNMSYGTITLKYCVTLLFHYMFIKRTFEG